MLQRKVIAKLLIKGKGSIDITNNTTSFVITRRENDCNMKNQSDFMISLREEENEENERGIICAFKIEKDPQKFLAPFILQSQAVMCINAKPIRSEQRVILQDKNQISLFKEPKINFIFCDLRKNVPLNLPEKILNSYYMERILRSGNNPSCFLVHDVRTLRKFALKRVPKLDIDKEDYAMEAKIMLNLDHPNIVKLVKVHDEIDKTFLFIEYMNRGDLLELINRSPYKLLPEKNSKEYFFQIVQGLKYLHDLNICHRDIKCDNIFVHYENDKYIIKIGDFGLSAYDINLSMKCGTFLYSAPELLESAKTEIYDGKMCDIWSLGVVLYCMLSGKFPFHQTYEDKLGPVEMQIQSGKQTFWVNENIWNKISFSAKHLICCMMVIDPEYRYNIHEIEKHCWLKKINYNPKRGFLKRSLIDDNINYDVTPPKRRKIDSKTQLLSLKCKKITV